MEDFLEKYATTAAVLAGFGTLDGGIRAVRELPSSAPRRGILAAALVERTLREASRAPERYRRPLEALVAIADTGPPPGPVWARLRTAARTAVIMMAAAQEELGDPAVVRAELESLRRAAGSDQALLDQLELANVAVEAALSGGTTDLASIDRVVERIRAMAARSPVPHTEADTLADAMVLMQEIMRAGRRGSRRDSRADRRSRLSR